ncbi:MAG: DUF551 domain-containing protein [Phycisphaerales bacterium]|nr:DUF551 domain-containing protein [Phycisphaerales bacterium]
MPETPTTRADDIATLRHDLDQWRRSTEFTRTCTRPVDAGDQMGLRDAAVLLDRFDALLAAPAEGEGWQPIETAPMGPDEDGCAVLILLGFAPDETGYALNTREGHWNSTLQRWSSTLDPDWTSSPQPTHWMPLPPAPLKGPEDE